MLGVKIEVSVVTTRQHALVYHFIALGFVYSVQGTATHVHITELPSTASIFGEQACVMFIWLGFYAKHRHKIITRAILTFNYEIY